MEKRNNVYILACGDGSFYTGWTNDLAARLSAHQSGTGAKYTRAHLPVTLVYTKAYATKEEAMSAEWHIKQLSHAEKEAIIEKEIDVFAFLKARAKNHRP